MSTTWEELKGQIVDLGFEEDETVNEEYERVLRNAVNRAQDMVRYSVVPYLEDYYKRTEEWGYLDTETNKWILPKPRRITESTLDTDRINLPDNLMQLVSLLAAHYLWLDDDITKAVTYWNEYDQYKTELLALLRQPKGAVIEGGW